MRETTKLKIIYFVTYSIYGLVLPFLPIILTEKGLDISAMSFAFLGFGVSATITPLIVAHFADRKFPWKILMSGLLITTSAIAQVWHSELTSTGFLFSIFLFFAFYLPAVGLLDAFTFKTIQKQNISIEFSSIRIFGSIGFVVPTLVSLYCSYKYSVDSTFLINFLSIMGLLSAVSAQLLPTIELSNKVVKFPIIPALKALFTMPIRPVYVGSALALVGLNIFYTLSPSYLKELNFSTVQVGLILNFAVLVEIIFMPFTKQYIGKFGIKLVVLLAILSVALRLVVLAGWTNTLVVLFMQSLHAPTIIGFYVAGTMFIVSNATVESQFSIQGLYTGTMLGVTRIIAILTIMAILNLSDLENLANIKILFLVGGFVAMLGAVFLILDNYKARAKI